MRAEPKSWAARVGVSVAHSPADLGTAKGNTTSPCERMVIEVALGGSWGGNTSPPGWQPSYETRVVRLNSPNSRVEGGRSQCVDSTERPGPEWVFMSFVGCSLQWGTNGGLPNAEQTRRSQKDSFSFSSKLGAEPIGNSRGVLGVTPAPAVSALR